MSWRAVLKGGPLDGSEGTAQWPPSPPADMWPMRCAADCPLARLAPDKHADFDDDGVHWLMAAVAALEPHQHRYSRVGVDRLNRHVYEYPGPWQGLAEGTAILREPTIVYDPPEPVNA